MSSKAKTLLMENDEIGAYTQLGLALTLRWIHQGSDLLSQPERRFLAVLQLHTTVNNGGFYSYFTGPSGDLAADALIGLREMGAEWTYAVAAQACSVFPGGIVPSTQTERETFLYEEKEDKWADLGKPNRHQQWLEPIDRMFYECPEKLSSLAVAFALRHIDEFDIE